MNLPHHIEPLLDRITAMYSLEKVASFLLPELRYDDQNIRVRHALMLEAEENQRQCERLESLIEILRPLKEETDGDKLDVCSEQVSAMLRRFSLKHINIGYDTSILIAQVMGRSDIADILRWCMIKDKHQYARVAG